MNRKRRNGFGCRRACGKCWAWFACLLVVSLAAACAGSKGTGLYAPLPAEEKKKVLEELKQNWQEYHVYCDGPVSAPGAVIFDPKSDDRNLVGYKYIRLSKDDSVKTAIVWIEYQLSFHPGLYRILDEENNFYGYVLVARDLPAPRRLDPKTLELPAFESGFFAP